MALVIAWLYGTKMNIYGDRGNVIALERRAAWRGIETRILELGIGDPVTPDIDLYFFGGGQDEQQVAVSNDLQGEKGQAIKAAVEDGAAMLAICGGYQLMGHVYRPHDAEPLPGTGLFDVETVAGHERFIGNIVVDTQWGELVGFENHSGLTHLGPTATPMGKVKSGRGNNGKDGTEGVLHRNAVGCYMHGALLPKNPGLADWLILQGLRYRDASVEQLPPLDDRFEDAARLVAATRG